MDPENERELDVLVARLSNYKSNDLPERFRHLTRTMIVPALEEIAQHIKAAGHDCTIEVNVDEPIPASGQAVYFNFDTRYEHGENSLCIRLAPGESLVRIETPAAGTVRTQNVPLSELGEGNIHRVAIDYVRREVQ